MSLLQTFWQIALMRRSPEVLPHSPFLLGITLLLHLLLGIGFGLLTGDVAAALAAAAEGTLLLFFSCYLLLTLHGLIHRLFQTVSAMAGSGFIIGLIAWPFNDWLVSVDRSQAALPGLLSLILVGWEMAVVAFIWRHALSVSTLRSILYAIGYMIASIVMSYLT